MCYDSAMLKIFKLISHNLLCLFLMHVIYICRLCIFNKIYDFYLLCLHWLDIHSDNTVVLLWLITNGNVYCQNKNKQKRYGMKLMCWLYLLFIVCSSKKGSSKRTMSLDCSNYGRYLLQCNCCYILKSLLVVQ